MFCRLTYTGAYQRVILISKDNTFLVLAKGIEHKGMALSANQTKPVESSLKDMMIALKIGKTERNGEQDGA